MSFLKTADLANAASFRARVMVGLVKVAGIVLAEDQSAMRAQRADKRIELANNVFRDPAAIVAAFIWPVLANTTIATQGLDAPDGDLEFQITAVWDQVAGVKKADKAAQA